MYKMIACVECTTVLRGSIMHVMREYKAGEGVYIRRKVKVTMYNFIKSTKL